MFALGVELLMRRAIMTRWNDREQPEWPPHPDRVFMALVAAFGETGEDANEQAALEWLESLAPPALSVSDGMSVRTPFTSYVPVNDTADPTRTRTPPVGTYPLRRLRQPRCFPTVVPESPTFHLTWNTDLPGNLRPALESVCGKVTYLGHSATPVRIWIEEKEVTPNLVPSDGLALCRLRVTGRGRLGYLVSRFKAGLRPLPSLWQGYALPRREEPAWPEGPFDPGLIVLRQVGGRRFPLESSSLLVDALRDELMRRHGPNAPEWLTGHAPDNSPSVKERPAFMPLSFVGRAHADGHLLGLALCLPRQFPSEEVALLYDLLFSGSDPSMEAEEPTAIIKLSILAGERSAPVGECELELDERPFSTRPFTLRPDTWLGPSRLWATTTPVILPQFPRRSLTPEDVVVRACRDAGYPGPCNVRTSNAPVVEGVPHLRSFPVRPRRSDRPPRPRTHAVIFFPEPIMGPVLLGAGRYNGFGVCRPLPEDSES